MFISFQVFIELLMVLLTHNLEYNITARDVDLQCGEVYHWVSISDKIILDNTFVYDEEKIIGEQWIERDINLSSTVNKLSTEELYQLLIDYRKEGLYFNLWSEDYEFDTYDWAWNDGY